MIYLNHRQEFLQQTIFAACKRQCSTKGRTTFVKTNGAEDKLKGSPFDISRKAEICLMVIENVNIMITIF